MPRANRHYIPGCVWHITHRCHKKEFLLNFDKDRLRLGRWLYEAKKRYGLCVLNYIVTSNHIHLLVVDTEEGVISKSLQLIAGRTAQEFNLRKNRKGAFWEDRYHSTAIETDEHLARCIVYIDLNRVRAGVVTHPSKYRFSGFHEVHNPPQRYRVIDYKVLMAFFHVESLKHFQQEHRKWIESELALESSRKSYWSESIAVGSEAFIKKLKGRLGKRGRNRSVFQENEGVILKEPLTPYRSLFDAKKSTLRGDNSYFLGQKFDTSTS